MKHLITLSLTCLAITATNAAEKPNIIFIMADDLGYGDLSCYGSKTIQTPHLDKLAAEGLKCTDFHTNGTVCSPTRAALFTGRYQQRCGISGVVTAKGHRDKGLAVSEWSMGDAMKEQGYTTAMFGKWHLGYEPRFNPVQHGFDQYKGFVSGNVDFHRKIDQEGHKDWWAQDKLIEEEGYVTDLITKAGLSFIEQHKDKPFLLCLTHGAPHYPLQGRNDPGFRVLGKTNRDQPKNPVADGKKAYKEMVEIVDDGVGQIVSKLEALKLRQKTLIIFCSDNGPASAGSSGILRGRKGRVYEGGHRVCGIFNWPKTIPAGTVSNETFITMDLLPTFVDIAGGKVAEEKKLDGISVLPHLKSGSPIPKRILFWQDGKATAVRDGDWKLVSSKSGPTELYNLKLDISEKNDLSKTNPDKVKELKDAHAKWVTDVRTKK